MRENEAMVPVFDRGVLMAVCIYEVTSVVGNSLLTVS